MVKEGKEGQLKIDFSQIVSKKSKTLKSAIQL